MTSPLWWRSLSSRPLIGALLFALSAAAVMTSALGPLFVRAVHQSSLADAVAMAGPAGSSIAASLNLEPGDDPDRAVDQVSQLFAAVDQGPSGALWHAPQLSVQTTSSVGWALSSGNRPEAASRVASAEAECAWLAVTAGRCPARGAEVLVSTADTARSGVRVGSTVTIRLPSNSTTALRVVGIYDPARSAAAPSLLRPTSVAGQLASLTGDPLITTRSRLTALGLESLVTDRLLLAKAMTAQDESAARLTLDRVKAATVAVEDQLVVFDSRLPQLLDDVDRRVASASVLILVTVVQAEALAVFALVIALQRLGRSRAAEWGVGRLRGMPTRPWLSSIWAEPVFALTLGLPVGLMAAVAVGSAVVAKALRPGTPVEWSSWAVLTAAVAVVVIALGALVAITARGIRRPLIELLQQASDSRRVSVVGAVVQSTVVLLAAVALYQLLSGGVLDTRGSQLALLAPSLFALAVAVITVRIAVVVVRRITSRPPRSLFGLVVGRHAARAPSALNPAMVVAAALALAVFSTQVSALSVRNQDLRAQAIVGADTVLQVGKPVDLDLVEAVRAADPSGRYAMAVQERAASSDGGTSRIVAVDSSRIEAVAPWTAAWAETRSLATSLHPARTQPVLLRGTRLELRTTDVSLTYAAVPGFSGPAQPPSLSLIVQRGRAGPWLTVPLGNLGPDPASYSARLPCATECRLVGIDLFTGKGQSYRTTFTIDRLSTDRTPASRLTPRLTETDGWRERIGHITGPERAESVEPSPNRAGLTISATDTDGENHNRVAPSDSADPLPAVLAPDLTVEPFPGMPAVVTGTGLDGQSQLIAEVARASILPRALDDGVLVDLRDAQALSDPADDEATSEVWLTATAPASVEKQLVAAGLTVLSRERLADTREALRQQGNTRGAAVAVWVAMAGLLIALLTFAGARAADAARRRADWAALQDAGHRPATTRRLAFVEIAAPALLGALVGILSGTAAVRLGASRLPLVDVYAAGPPLDLHLAVAPIVWLSVGSGLVIVVVAAVGAWSETHRRSDR